MSDLHERECYGAADGTHDTSPPSLSDIERAAEIALHESYAGPIEPSVTDDLRTLCEELTAALRGVAADNARLACENAELRNGARRKQALLEAAERRAEFYNNALVSVVRRISKTGLARVVAPGERTEPELPAPDGPQ